ncbi:hypothetical protein LPC08_11300 [Roseomonas sp. OT10]|uniref:hypothetical protein n=1 Tax=Roseomonas cutis TaxID=2897332 RepID=UPI001E3857FB|nr:hypothetical protein [Roseomonas sp. OT10]UFN51142.1 hypothetical protein LPC08_11300 [Roseomonas sp. OT10]
MTADLVARLAIPGLPEWSGLIVLLLALLAAIAFLLMPFSVFGVKGRLEGIEAQLDEIQQEIRLLAMRLPEPGGRRPPMDEGWEEAPPRLGPVRDTRPLRASPPIPPPPVTPDGRGMRQEPRFR